MYSEILVITAWFINVLYAAWYKSDGDITDSNILPIQHRIYQKIYTNYRSIFHYALCN